MPSQRFPSSLFLVPQLHLEDCCIFQLEKEPFSIYLSIFYSLVWWCRAVLYILIYILFWISHASHVVHGCPFLPDFRFLLFLSSLAFQFVIACIINQNQDLGAYQRKWIEGLNQSSFQPSFIKNDPNQSENKYCFIIDRPILTLTWEPSLALPEQDGTLDYPSK